MPAILSVKMLGYYTPLMSLTAKTVCTDDAMSSPWQRDTGSPVCNGYQILSGAGFGMWLQQLMLALQTVLSTIDKS